VVVTLLFTLALAAAQPRPSSAAPHRGHASCTDAPGYEVRLDRLGFPAGEIDGTYGPDLRKAVTAYQKKKRLAATGQLNCDTLHALESDAGRRLLNGLHDHRPGRRGAVPRTPAAEGAAGADRPPTIAAGRNNPVGVVCAAGGRGPRSIQISPSAERIDPTLSNRRTWPENAAPRIVSGGREI
jgi:hypothetical protein